LVAPGGRGVGGDSGRSRSGAVAITRYDWRVQWGTAANYGAHKLKNYSPARGNDRVDSEGKSRLRVPRGLGVLCSCGVHDMLFRWEVAREGSEDWSTRWKAKQAATRSAWGTRAIAVRWLYDLDLTKLVLKFQKEREIGTVGPERRCDR